MPYVQAETNLEKISSTLHPLKSALPNSLNISSTAAYDYLLLGNSLWVLQSCSPPVLTQKMIFLRRFPSVQSQIYVAKFYLNRHLSKVDFHSHITPPRPNKILRRYVETNSTTKALLLFSDLFRKSPSSIDSYSVLFAIKACTKKSSGTEGKQIHAVVISLGYEPIIFLQTSLINMYSGTASLADAHQMFEEIPTKNVVCWTALISAYVDNQKPNDALQLFRKMQMGSVEPDRVTVTVALSACADLGALDMGQWIHGYIRRAKELSTDLCLNNALINMYAKCGDIGTAMLLFDTIKKKDVTTWTSMIVGHALHGQPKAALRLFAAMTKETKSKRTRMREGSHRGHVIVPNDVTFVGVLMACSHAGLVEEGKRHFRSMTTDYGLKPRLSHFGCMVDLLCRAGLLREAYELVLAMPIEPNAVLWRTLLGACSINGNIGIAAQAHCQLLELEESLIGDDVIMSNIYASKGMWDKKIVTRDQISQRRAPGCSSIELGSGITEFVSSDYSHSFAYEIYEALEQLIGNMRACSYTPGLST